MSVGAGVEPYRVPTGQGSMDHFARLVRRALDVPVALVTLVEADRQVFPGQLGLPEPWCGARATPLTHSFCQHVVAADEPLVIPDARLDERLRDNLAIPDLGVVAYAGWPLRDVQDRPIGSLCAIDTQPRAWTGADLALLEDLALAVSSELQHRFALESDRETLTRTLVDTIDVGVLFFDAEHRFLMGNGMAHRLADLGGVDLTAAPWAGPHVRRADNLTPVPEDEQSIGRALRGAAPVHDTCWMGRRGHERAVMSDAHRVLRDDGSLLGTLVGWHDVTALTQAVQVKEEFVATVSHELRTPLAAVLGYAEVLADELEELGPASSGAQQALEVIRRRARDLEARIEDLLKLAELRSRMEFRTCDLAGVVRRVADDFATQAQAAGVSVELDVADGLTARVDEGWIGQAVESLVGNALRYTPAGGHVLVAVSGDDERVVLTVSDDGVGMSPSECTQAFDRFWRAERSHREAVPGFGLGLTLVRDVIAAHHGTVHLESEPGHGTAVVCELPRSSLRLLQD